MECYCHLRNDQDLLAGGKKLIVKGDSENHLKAQWFRLTPWLNINRFLHETSQGSINLARNFDLGYSSDMHQSRREFGKEIFWSWTLRNWKNMDASEVHLRRINAKEVWTPQRREDFIFPTVDGTAKLSGRDHEFREPTLRRKRTVRSEDFSGELHG